MGEVAGSEDSNVYFYDLTRPRHTCVNKLQVNLILAIYSIKDPSLRYTNLGNHFPSQGHSSSVIGITWNHGENLLASSDSGGTVIVWKRAKTSS